jgi:branched-chain amino acid transport system ATP-binding protein
MVPEGRQLFPQMTVLENLDLGAYAPRVRKRRAANLERVFSLFPRLKEPSDQKAGTFSGGEQQMLAEGRVHTEGPSRRVAEHGEIRAAYLGL